MVTSSVSLSARPLPSLPICIILQREPDLGASSLEDYVASSRLNFLFCPRSRSNVGDVDVENSDFHAWKRKNLKRNSCARVVGNGILDAIMES